MTRRPKLLQVCNVGRIVGGTAACAWTVTRALPGIEHHVAFLSACGDETAAAFLPAPVSIHATVDQALVDRICPDVVLLHNTPAWRFTAKSRPPTVQYLHSRVDYPAPSDVVLCCSRWLAERISIPTDGVLWQAVPKCRVGLLRSSNRRLTVGRLCTPTRRKWSGEVVPFYAELSRRFPEVAWEFVGCPPELVSELRQACRGRAVFHAAGWEQRSQFATWDVLLYSNPGLPESFGRTVAEAMRTGCIPVVDRLGGFIEQVAPDCGFLCETLDEFATALQHLREPTFRQQVSHRCRQHADHHFSLRQFARDLLPWFDAARKFRGEVFTLNR